MNKVPNKGQRKARGWNGAYRSGDLLPFDLFDSIKDDDPEQKEAITSEGLDFTLGHDA